MAALPTGLVTFVFTDIEGSTRLLAHLGEEAFGELLGEHHRILRAAIAGHEGVEVNTLGDAFFMVFASADDALAAMLEAHVAMTRHPWPRGTEVRVRIGLHTGVGRLGGDDYVGLPVHQAARVCSAAHGGQIVVTQAARDAVEVAPDGATWLSLGRHRLKDLGAAVELFQLCHPDLAAELPPLRSLERVAHNLPIQASTFLGREAELATGAALLAGTRMLSATGPGGTGKTRLAYQLAAEHLHEYPDGVWVAELAPVSDPARVPAALMAAIGLRDEPGASATETIISTLRTRRALVVLDNCEHLVAAAATLATDLLENCPHVRVLTTTREPLRVRGETVWALAPLGLPVAGDVPIAELAAADAVALFCERAAEARAGFALTAANAAYVARICARLEGIPLAIELAAARVRSLPLSQIADRLDQSFDLLTKGARGAHDRQASLRGAISWSHDLLSAPEQVLFRRLAVFAGGFTLEAAEGVTSGEKLAAADVLDLLDGLVDKSLVSLGQERAGEERYSMLETIRAHAAECALAAGEGSEVPGHHAAFHARLAHECAAEGEAVAALDRLEADHANMLAAVDHLCASDQAMEHGRLVVDLSAFWAMRGHWQTGRRELLRYLDRPDRDHRLAGECFHALATLAERMGEYGEARARYGEALRVAHELGERRLEGQATFGIGRAALFVGDYAEAQVRHEEGLALARELGDRGLEGDCLSGLGHVASNLGDHATARTRFDEALVIAFAENDRELESQGLGGLGVVAYRVGDYPDARARYEQVGVIARELGDRAAEGAATHALGNIAMRLGDDDEAFARYEEARRIAHAFGDRCLEGFCARGLGNVACRRGEPAEARRRFEEARAIALELGDIRLESFCLLNLGELDRGLGNHAQAREHVDAALRTARALGDRGFESECLGGLGDVAASAADPAAARAHYQAALAIANELGERTHTDAWERGLRAATEQLERV